MPTDYPGTGRLTALEMLLPSEQGLVAKYEAALGLGFAEEIQTQLKLHLALAREHVFTQEKLLENARRIEGIV